MGAAQAAGGDDIVDGSGEHDTQGNLAVIGCIAGVQRPARRGKIVFALQGAAEFGVKAR